MQMENGIALFHPPMIRSKDLDLILASPSKWTLICINSYGNGTHNSSRSDGGGGFQRTILYLMPLQTRMMMVWVAVVVIALLAAGLLPGERGHISAICLLNFEKYDD